jgi:hypothetical protein
MSTLARDVSLLIRQELALAKSEITSKFGQLGTGAGLLAAAGVLAFAALLYLMAAGMMALSIVLPMWAGALIIAGVALAIAGALAIVGKSRMKTETLAPTRTMRTLKEDAVWVQEKMQ